MTKLVEHDAHFSDIALQLVKHDAHFSDIALQLVKHDAHFSDIALQFEKHDAHFSDIALHLVQHNKRFDRAEDATHQLGIKFENLESSVKLVLDVVLATQEKLEKYDTLDKQVTDHGHRIAAVEHFISRHPD